jgi:hypothetical protein
MKSALSSLLRTAPLGLSIAAVLCAAFVLSTDASGQEPPNVERAKQLMRKSQSGEKLSPEEAAFLDRVREDIRRRAAAGGGQPQAPAHPAGPRPSPPANPDDWKALVPITEMTAPYKGEDGGLYGGGRNEPPEAHRRAHVKESEGIVPRDASGRPADDGKIGLISIGFSNPSIEWEAFMRAAAADPQKSPRVVIVNGCMGGRSAAMWAWDGAEILPRPERERLDKEMDLLGMPKENRRTSLGVAKDTWPTLARRIEAAGLSPPQVQVCWLKHVEANPAPLGEFPAHARVLQADIAAILNIAKHRYPNLRVVYLSSRTFGGWSGRAGGSPEPYAYESGFGTRWVVEGQIEGDPHLNFDPARGRVRAPFVLWGPYLWARGDTPRKLDGLTWTLADVRADQLHPNETGAKKTTKLLLDFFRTNEGTSRWFLRQSERAGPARSG